MTRIERTTSAVKSIWPGVSIRLMRWPSQWQAVAAEVMVMPRSRSWSIQSNCVFSIVHAAGAMHASRVVQDRLRRGRLAGIHMRENAYDAYFFKRCFFLSFTHFVPTKTRQHSGRFALLRDRPAVYPIFRPSSTTYSLTPLKKFVKFLPDLAKSARMRDLASLPNSRGIHKTLVHLLAKLCL